MLGPAAELGQCAASLRARWFGGGTGSVLDRKCETIPQRSRQEAGKGPCENKRVSHQQHGRAAHYVVSSWQPPPIANVTGLNKRERGLLKKKEEEEGGTWKGDIVYSQGWRARQPDC